MLCTVHVNKFQIFINLHCLSVVCKLWVYGYVRNYNWEDETLSGGAGDHPNGGQHSLTGKGGLRYWLTLNFRTTITRISVCL